MYYVSRKSFLEQFIQNDTVEGDVAVTLIGGNLQPLVDNKKVHNPNVKTSVRNRGKKNGK